MSRERFAAEIVAAGTARSVAAPDNTFAVPDDAGSPGDIVLLARTTSGEPPVHNVVCSLADGLSAKAALWRLALGLGHPASHSTAVLAEADACLRSPGIDDPALLDCTSMPFVTIDNAGSRDLDQAIFVEASSDGFCVRYALADASYYVRPGSALFEEAIARGASYYMPGVSIPMLPRSLSEGLISLCAKEARRSVVMEMQLDTEGRCSSAKLVRAKIRSRAKLTYAAVQAFYAAGDHHPLAGTAYAESLRCLAEVGKLRIALARAADVVSFHRSEVDVQIEGASFSLVSDRRLPIERYNEQISLLCNVEGARMIAHEGVQGVFKVHGPPPSDKLERFVRLVDALVQVRGLDRDSWRWHRGREPLADYIDRLPRSGPHAHVSQAIERQAMMTNIGSAFSTGAAPHHGVGAEAYARFSAPMREVVGVFTHKEALEHAGLIPQGDPEADVELRERVVTSANRARQRQSRLTKSVNQHVLDTLMARELKMGERQRWRVGTLLGMSATKLYVQLDLPPIEIKVYVRDLPRDGARPRILAHGASFQLGDREIAVGDRLELRVSGRSERSGRWAFEMRFL
ncbi:MAG: RNB domain-containing ribonuclease [Myxococcales bacterium]|nr:RNB domain-containing ribonuclease [Myxococcales bacterium]